MESKVLGETRGSAGILGAGRNISIDTAWNLQE